MFDSPDLSEYRARLDAALNPSPQGEGPSIDNEAPGPVDMGAGPQIADDGSEDPDGPPAQGQMAPTIDGQGAGGGAAPSIGQGPPPVQPAAQAAPGYAVSTPTLDRVMPNPVAAPATPAPGAQRALALDGGGMTKPGNLDPFNRKILNNPDGSYSTTSSISIGTDEGEVLIPTVVDGKRLSEPQAIAHYRKTGQNFGTFKDAETADKYATDLHNQQASAAESKDPSLGRARPATIDGAGQGTTPLDAGGSANIAPAAAHRAGDKTPDGKHGIDVHPPGFDPGAPSNYKSGAIEDLQKNNPDPKPSDVFHAMKPRVQSKYMDWWEKQHGDIEQRYEALHQDIGARPDPNREPTKKEKFQMLMDFGISLLQHSRRSSPYEMPNTAAASGDALRESMDRQKGRQVNQTADYDARAGRIQSAKEADLKNIGTYGQAAREDSSINLNMTRQAIAEMRALRPPTAGQPVTRVLSDGSQVQYDPTDGTWNPSTDKQGKPLGNMPLQGPRGGGQGHESAVIQQIKDMTSNGVPYATALATVYRIKPGMDARKTFQSIYNVERHSGESADDAKARANEIVDELHGQGAMGRAAARDNSTIVPTDAPPISAMQPGKVNHFKDGSGKVTNWIVQNGKALQTDGNGNPLQAP